MTIATPVSAMPAHAVVKQPGPMQAFILVIAASLTVMVVALLGPSLPLMEQHFRDVPNVSYWVPMTITIPMLTMAFCSVFIGMLSDRIGRKRLLVTATVLYSVFGTAPLYLPSLGAIVVSRAVLGLTESALMVVSTSMIGDYFHGAKRDRLNTLQVGLPALVGFVMNIVGGLFAEPGWRTPYVVYAVSLLLAPLMMICLWEPVRARPGVAAPGAQHEEPAFRPALLALICLLGMATGFVYLVVPVNFGYLLEALPGTSTTAIGTAYGLNSLGAIAGALVFGWVMARRFSVATQLGTSAAIAAAGFLLMPGASTYGALTVAGFVNGLGCGILLPALVTWTQRSIPSAKRGLGNGAFQSALYLGMSTSPLLVVGLQSQLGGRLAAVAAIGTVLAVLAGFAVLYAAFTGSMKVHAAVSE
jgi:MFS family permease